MPDIKDCGDGTRYQRQLIRLPITVYVLNCHVQGPDFEEAEREECKSSVRLVDVAETFVTL